MRPGVELEADGVPSEEALVEAWEALGEGDRAEVVEWLRAECDNAEDYRSTLEQYMLSKLDDREFDFPEAEPAPFFDPEEHTPAQIIPRRFVDPEGDKRLEKTLKGLRSGVVKKEFVPAFEYDWRRGMVVRTETAWDDPARIVTNAARGFSPYTDLVEALVCRQLDRPSPGAEAMEPYADLFGHAYADRDGRAFRGITLYNAWVSGAPLEMPDVEVLGIYHGLTDDWTTYVAPIPPRQHGELYPKIAEWSKVYRRYRALRVAIARSYLQGRARIPREYAVIRKRIHGLWESVSSDPATLAPELPAAADWGQWMNDSVLKIDNKPEIMAGGRARAAALKESKAWTRRTLYGILREYGAFKEPSKGK